MPPPSVGTRVVINSFRGTAAYVGPVVGTQGEWIGVDWDDPSRGKNDGSKDGIRYFECRIPGPHSGSFVRTTSPSISLGMPFLQALSEKYIDTEHASDAPDSVEKVVLGSSGGSIIVEAPGLQKVRGRLADLAHLREVSFEPGIVNGPGEPGEITGKCPNIRGLDMSGSLLRDWNDVAGIVSQLPVLERLTLNDNRFAHLKDESCVPTSVVKTVQELRLNKTFMTLEEVFLVARLFPNLGVIELGLNGLQRLTLPSSTVFETLESINLDSNQLEDWSEIMALVNLLPLLSRLVLSSNKFSEIPSLTGGSTHRRDKPLHGVKRVSLAHNGIHSWSSIAALTEWLPHLEGLSMQGNPIMEVKNSRSLTIGRMAILTSFNGSSISANERKDSELFYLSHIVRLGLDPEQRKKEHPRWEQLCKEHGSPEENLKGLVASDKLGSRLMELSILIFDEEPSTNTYHWDIPRSIASKPKHTVRVLPSMVLRTLRLKIVKTLGLSHVSPSLNLRMWAILRSGEDIQLCVLRELDINGDGNKALDWWGLEAGSGVGVWTSEVLPK